MSLEQTLDRIAVALEILAAKAVPVPTPAASETDTPLADPQPAQRKRRTNAEIAADKAKETAALATAGESESSGEADAAPAAAKVLTVADVSAAIVAGIKAGLRDQVKAVLTKFGATNASTIKPKDIAKAVAELTELAEVAG